MCQCSCSLRTAQALHPDPPTPLLLHPLRLRPARSTYPNSHLTRDWHASRAANSYTPDTPPQPRRVASHALHNRVPLVSVYEMCSILRYAVRRERKNPARHSLCLSCMAVTASRPTYFRGSIYIDSKQAAMARPRAAAGVRPGMGTSKSCSSLPYSTLPLGNIRSSRRSRMTQSLAHVHAAHRGRPKSREARQRCQG